MYMCFSCEKPTKAEEILRRSLWIEKDSYTKPNSCICQHAIITTYKRRMSSQEKICANNKHRHYVVELLKSVAFSTRHPVISHASTKLRFPDNPASRFPEWHEKFGRKMRSFCAARNLISAIAAKLHVMQHSSASKINVNKKAVTEDEGY